MLRVYTFIAAGVLITAIGATAAYVTFVPNARSCGAGRVAGGAIGGPFTLVDEAGKTVTDAQVITKPTLVYFGYTFCPDVCPLDTARNAEAADLLRAKGYDVQTVFISIDPDRDTPAALTEFTDFHHPDMLGLTGDAAQIKAAAQSYKVYYNAHKDEDPEYYLVDHSTFTYLMLPQTGFADFFRREETAEDMAERSACLIDNQPS